MNIRTIKTMGFALVLALSAVVSISAAANDKPLTKAEVKNLIANAELKADHERLAKHFETEAVRYEAEAKEHAELAQLYQRSTSATPTKHPGGQQSFQHCDSLSKSLQQAAENARQLAAEHSEMAKEAKK
jgi:hypothetical protein